MNSDWLENIFCINFFKVYNQSIPSNTFNFEFRFNIENVDLSNENKEVQKNIFQFNQETIR